MLTRYTAFKKEHVTAAVILYACVRCRLSMDTGQAKLSVQLSGIISRVIRHCLLALSEPTTTSSSSSCGACQAAAGQGAGPPALRAAGYLCSEMQGDMKYILAFSSPRVR